MIKKCLLCEKEFETIKHGGKRIYCFECNPSGTSNSITLLRRKAREIGIEKLGGKCIHCGVDKSYLLDFHHREPEKKYGEMSDLSKGYDFSKFFDEIDKCDLLCANCHREFHYLNINKGILYEDYFN